jgi:D-glycero-D-manno-heptose 1,7-bisphosphate phosphatase
LRKAVFLDRDGVLNQTVFRMGKPRAPYTMDEFALYDGVKEGLELLKDKDFLLIVVTNQPDVARGWVSREAVDMVNDKIKELLPIDDLYACFHVEKDQCNCRKPKPGMLISAGKKWNIDFNQSFMLGDRISDVEAGISAGTKTILIGEEIVSGSIRPDYQKESLFEAAKLIATLT